MAFTMRHGLGPFRQEATGQPVTNEQQTEETKPVRYTDPGPEPNWLDPKYDGQGTRKVKVFQGKPRNRVLNAEIENIKAKAGDYQFTGDVSTQEGYTRRIGSAFNNFFTGDGYSVTKDYGSANTIASALGTKFETSEQKDEFYENLKNTLEEGKGATIVNGQITSGGDHEREEKYSLRGAAKKQFWDARNNFNKQKNAEALTEKQKAAETKRAETNALLEAKKAENAKLQEAKVLAYNERGKATADKIAAYRAAVEAKKNGGKKPVEETQSTTNEPVAQQNRTPFYQRGMMSDKMLLQNKNKIMSKSSPFEQERNSNTGEFLISDNTIKRDSIGPGGEIRGIITENKKKFKTPGKTTTVVAPEEEKKKETKPVVVVKKKVPAAKVKAKVVTKTKAVTKPKKVVKPKPVVSSNTTAPTSEVTPANPTTSEITTPDTEREESTSSFEPAVQEKPKEEPNKSVFSTNTHFVKQKGKEESTGFGNMFKTEKTASCGCP